MRIISQKLRDSARGQECTLRLAGCRFNPEHTALCHLPVGQKGIGMKSPDLFACFGCDHCHGVIDGRIPGEFTHADLLRAMAETQLIWIRDGLLVVKGRLDLQEMAGRPVAPTGRRWTDTRDIT